MPIKKCNEPECTKGAQGKTDKCVEHGGGKRCNEPECTKSAIGKTDKCIAHGGGKRCNEPGCTKGARGKTDKCVEHGGGKRCNEPGCTKSAIGKTDKCKAHGGGKRCNEHECTKGAEGKTDKCVEHGGGNTILAIETDEFGHIGYDQKDEEIRYHDLYMIHSGKWVFIRFNPDDNFSKVDIDDKLDVLVDKIKECILRIQDDKNSELLEIYKLYC